MSPTPYYQDDHVTLYHGDCLEVLPTLSGVDCVVTSPPYNLSGDGNNSAGTYFSSLGDGGLRAFAVAQEVEVRGVLWLIDELHRHGVDTAANLLVVLEKLAVDLTVRLPRRELAAFIKRYRALC